MAAILSIGEAARQAGLKASAIRFYEKAGLLPKPVRIAGRRRYPESVLDRLALIEFAKSSGFTLEEIRRLFRASYDGVAIPERWRQLARSKIAELDRRAQQIETMKGLLERALRCRCVNVEECGRKVRTGS